MDSGEVDKGLEVEATQEAVYPLKLRTPLVKYFQSGLSRVYTAEQQEIQKEGSYQKNLEFKTGRFSKVMEKLTPLQDGEQQSHITIGLSHEDISLMTSKLPTSNSTDYAGSRIHQELVGELKADFQSAKNTATLKRQTDRVRRFFIKKQ